MSSKSVLTLQETVRLTTFWTTNKLSPEGAHHRILDSLPELIRNGEIILLTPEYVTMSGGKTPTFHSKSWHPCHENAFLCHPRDYN